MTVWSVFGKVTGSVLRSLGLVALVLGLLTGPLPPGVSAAPSFEPAPLTIQAPAAASASAPAAAGGTITYYVPYVTSEVESQGGTVRFSPDGMTTPDFLVASAVSSITVQEISAGWTHSCALRPDNTVVCWGLNALGQATPPAGTFIQVTSGADNTCALKADGSVTCWGSNQYGQSTPPAATFTQISAGWYHVCGVQTDGKIACWGSNEFTQLNNIPNSATNVFTQVSAGGLHTCALKNNGAIACWGWNNDNQATAPAGAFSQISAGGYHTCALNAAGNVSCWGYNSAGQGAPISGTFKQVSAGGYHNCAIATDGSVSCWGENGYSQLNNIPAGIYKEISAGGRHSCALKTDGSVACWGWNRYGQSIPPAGVQVSAGGSHVCSLSESGALTCWGSNSAGQATPPAGTFRKVSAGALNTCALSGSDTLACWGSNAAGQSAPPAGTYLTLSTGKDFACALTPQNTLACWGNNSAKQAAPPAGAFYQVSAGGDFACALQFNGELSCWGSSANGKTTPPAGPFTTLSAGGQHACALRVDGTAACWGSNTKGQTSAPSGQFTQVSAGGSHTCALKSDGTAVCWGDNANGQSTPPASVFTQIDAGDSNTCGVLLDGSVLCWGIAGPPPTITIKPDTLPDAAQGMNYSQQLSASGATAPYTFKITSGSLPKDLTLSAQGLLSGTPSEAGNFTFTVEALDSSSTPFSGSKSYTLHVEAGAGDTTPPVITAHVSGKEGKNGWYVSDVTVTWTVVDAESPITATTGCDARKLTSDTTGETLTCSATSAGGTASKSVTIKIDKTAPVNVRGTADRQPDLNDWYNHPVTITFHGEDATSGIAACTVITYSGEKSEAAAPQAETTPSAAELEAAQAQAESGTYTHTPPPAVTVEGTCEDKAGNVSAPAQFSLRYDAAPPMLRVVVFPNPVFLNGEVKVIPLVVDKQSGVAKVTCDKADTSSIGEKEVSCTATDKAGNTVTASAKYNVIYKFIGFFPPVKFFHFWNTVTAGQTVPLRFLLLDAHNRPVTDAHIYSVDVKTVACSASKNPGAAVADSQESQTLGFLDAIYHYNWKTLKEYEHSCKQVTVNLGEGDGFGHSAWFKFR